METDGTQRPIDFNDLDGSALGSGFTWATLVSLCQRKIIRTQTKSPLSSASLLSFPIRQCMPTLAHEKYLFFDKVCAQDTVI